MAGHCFLLSLPGELLNNIYDAVHTLEGITLIGDHTQVHPLGRTCHQLHQEVVSRTSANAEKDVQVTVRARIYDFDFQDLRKWLAQHPCPSSSRSKLVDVRKFELTIVIRPSDSLAGLPYKEEQHTRSLFPTPIRHVHLLEHNTACAMTLGKWSVDRHADANKNFGVLEHSQDRPARLDFYHRDTFSSCLIQFAVEVQDPMEKRYSKCWPKRRPQMQGSRLPPALPPYGYLEDDYLESARLASYETLYHGDYEDNEPFRWVVAMSTWGHTKLKACPVGSTSCTFDCVSPDREDKNTVAEACLEERYKLYDRKLFIHLEHVVVTKRALSDRGRLENPMNLKCMNAMYNLRRTPPRTMKREEEDDQRNPRKRRAIDISGIDVEKAWRAEVESVPQGDVDMLCSGLSGLEMMAGAETGPL
nr:hypothetical protein B0A51_07632 [Rachicladosporium sp. CCFEE 5018]